MTLKLEKLELIRRCAHDSMWYSTQGRSDAYAAILHLIALEKEPEQIKELSKAEEVTETKKRGRPAKSERIEE